MGASVLSMVVGEVDRKGLEDFSSLMQIQQKQTDWSWQWQNYQDDEQWLFCDWIHPLTLEDFRDQRVLDAGCGGGQHLSFVAPYAREVVGVDLNTVPIAAERNHLAANVKTVEADIARLTVSEPFDIVYSIGVVHHTDDPDATFANLAKLTRPGGKTIVWVYSYEGNFLNRTLVEGLKWIFVSHLPKAVVRVLSHLFTALLYLPVYTLYFLPLHFLPYYQYLKNFRKLSFYRNDLNVFDKLNAPQTEFISRDRIERWFRENGYQEVHISLYRGVSWRGSGTKL